MTGTDPSEAARPRQAPPIVTKIHSDKALNEAYRNLQDARALPFSTEELFFGIAQSIQSTVMEQLVAEGSFRPEEAQQLAASADQALSEHLLKNFRRMQSPQKESAREKYRQERDRFLNSLSQTEQSELISLARPQNLTDCHDFFAGLEEVLTRTSKSGSFTQDKD